MSHGFHAQLDDEQRWSRYEHEQQKDKRKVDVQVAQPLDAFLEPKPNTRGKDAGDRTDDHDVQRKAEVATVGSENVCEQCTDQRHRKADTGRRRPD